MDIDLISKLTEKNDSKMILLVIDGIGDLSTKENPLTPLEYAKTPNLDKLTEDASCGQIYHVGHGITPGSGPGHTALFGYDPLKYEIGRGVLEALGIGFNLLPNDVAARGNFCTLDENGNITDRRAGRISTEENEKRVKVLKEIKLPSIEAFVETVKDYRFVLVLRGEGLEDGVTETDPQKTGVPPMEVRPLNPNAKKTADLINLWMKEAKNALKGMEPANGCNLRGISKDPKIPKMPEIYKMRFAAIATYPMYRGIAKLVGMDVLETGSTLEDEIKTLKENWENYDFFFIHVKKTDSYGEDGNFEGKVSVIEEVDRYIPEILSTKPDCLVVTGDHSTPVSMKSHSWHPVPLVLWSKNARKDDVKEFSEKSCYKGCLGTFHAKEIMPLMMAHCMRFTKFGA